MNTKELTLNECIYNRRTVRKYTGEIIPDNVLKEILKAAVYAPSACNFQAWKIIVLNDQDKKKEFVKAYGKGPRGGKPRIESCQQGVLMTYRNDLGVSGRRYGDYIQSAAAAIQNMILMAENYGVGCCWICDLPDAAEIRRIFSIPNTYDIIAFVSMGYPVIKQGTSISSQIYHYGSEENYINHKRRYTMEQFVSFNQFCTINGDSSQAKYPKYNTLAKLKEKYPTLYGVIQIVKKRGTPNSET